LRLPTVKWARGTGGVEATLGSIAAVAQTVEVDVASREVRLFGGVKLTRGRGWVEAASASIDLASHKVTLKDVKGSVPVAAPGR
jgi:lipopolysaccharide export system protein LptA